MLKQACLIILLGTFHFAFAQQTQSPKPKKTNIFFLKNNGKYTDRDSSDYMLIISEPDSGSVFFNAAEFYKNGSRKFIGKSSKSEYLSAEGQCLSFYPNGNKKSVENFKEGNHSGLSYYFYPNGKIYNSKEFLLSEPVGNSVEGDVDFEYLIKDCIDSTGKTLVTNGQGFYVGYSDDFKYIEEKGPVKNGKRDSVWTGKNTDRKIKFTEQYANGLLVSGEAVDSMGVSHHYTKRILPPEYKGGMKALYRYLSNHIRYPDHARDNNIQGVVMLGFVVKKDGTLKDLKVLKAVDEELEREALRVISNSPVWQPASYFGIPVNIYYSIPVNFALN
jgi:TonB family protein